MSTSKILPRLTGKAFENRAEKYLHQQGLRLVTRNYHCRFGEIDLIMTQNHTLVFIEVRARKNANFGSAIETVDAKKQQKIIQTARHFLQSRHAPDYDAIRFDVVGFEKGLTWMQNAFSVD